MFAIFCTFLGSINLFHIESLVEIDFLVCMYERKEILDENQNITCLKNWRENCEIVSLKFEEDY